MRAIYKRPKVGQMLHASRIPRDDDSSAAQLPNSLVMRVMQESDAEREADSLSAGVSSTDPEALREEMGGRLGADFSGVRFHNDSASMSRSRSMGARAWTRGSDVYFGRGGFDPAVAAHELVHTVQQGAVRGNVSQSMPSGVVQLWPDENDDKINKDSVMDAKKSGVDPLEGVLLGLFSTDIGRRCYRDIEKKMKEMIQKGAGKPIQNYSAESAIHFVVEGANRLHAGKEILQEIAGKPLESKDDAKERAKEYKAFFKFLTTGLGEFGIEEIAVENEMNNRPPKYEHARSTKDTRTKRAWELDDHSKNKDKKMIFNPTNDPELDQVQAKIDAAGSAAEAYSAFSSFTGNTKAKFKDDGGTAKTLDISMLKKKLKHMARVVIDYPELRGNIGDMRTYSKTKTVKDKDTGKNVKKENMALMGTDSTRGYRKKATFYYNAWMDRRGAEDERRTWDNRSRWDNLLLAPRDYAGTHELGHVMASTLQDPENETESLVQQNFSLIENSMLQSAANKSYMNNKMSFDDISNMKREQISTKRRDFSVINPEKSGFAKKGYTSKYGADNPSEFFAEAVSDVYAHGKDAKPMSIEIVKEYEKRRTDAVKKNFFVQAKKKPSLFRKLFGWLPFL